MGRTFCVSDIHGNWDIWKAIKNKLKPDDILYILGDCADRGDRGWDIIKEAINHPQVIYLKGNHEDMLAKAIREVEQYEYCGDCYRLLAYNGGTTTFNSWSNDGSYYEWANILNKLPTIATYKNIKGDHIFLSHAGYTPIYFAYKPDEEDLIWGREHFLDEWPEDPYLQNVYIIHGHTPIPYLAEDIARRDCRFDEPFWYCNNHKCCIDNLTIFTKSTVLLDLDSFEYIIIE